MWFQNRRNKWKRDMALKLDITNFNIHNSIPYNNNTVVDQTITCINTNVVNQAVEDCYADSSSSDEQNMTFKAFSDCCYGNTAVLEQPQQWGVDWCQPWSQWICIQITFSIFYIFQNFFFTRNTTKNQYRAFHCLINKFKVTYYPIFRIKFSVLFVLLALPAYLFTYIP